MLVVVYSAESVGFEVVFKSSPWPCQVRAFQHQKASTKQSNVHFKSDLTCKWIVPNFVLSKITGRVPTELIWHLQSVCREFSCRKTDWRRGQQGDLCVRWSDLADGAMMLTTATGQVLSELPSFPSPLKLLLYLSVYEAVEDSNHKTLCRWQCQLCKHPDPKYKFANFNG